MLIVKAFLLAALCCLTAGLSYAQPANLDKAQPPPPQTDNKATHTKEVGKTGKTVQPESTSLPANINDVVGGKLDLTSEMKEPKTPDKKQERFSEFFNVKLTDIAIAIFTIVIGVYTICLTMATGNLVIISGKQEESTRVVERAYVKMSHKSPGLEPNYVFHCFDITLHIRNFGETPATITSVVLTHKILEPGDPLPATPEYAPETGNLVRRVFLVREDEFFTSQRINVSPDDFGLAENGAMDLSIYGHVDYVDQFGKRHRAGYARRYTPRGNTRQPHVMDEQFNNRSNLIYVTQPGYNYDTPRKNGEGNDWNDPV